MDPIAVPPQVEPPAPTGTGSPPDSAPAHSDHSSDVNSTAQEGDSHNQVNDPEIVPLRQTAPSDIQYFFVRSGDKIVCSVCRQGFLCSHNIILREKAKEARRPNLSLRPYGYSQRTSNAILRSHIEQHHLEFYLTVAKEEGWNTRLVQQAREQATNEAAAAQGEQLDNL
jgi:hypothetical protein